MIDLNKSNCRLCMARENLNTLQYVRANYPNPYKPDELLNRYLTAANQFVLEGFDPPANTQLQMVTE